MLYKLSHYISRLWGTKSVFLNSAVIKPLPTLPGTVALLILAYFVGYFSVEGLPGNDIRHPLGWWGWFDQGKYLQATEAFRNLNFSADQHFYPPLYPLLGALFVDEWPKHPFWLINLLSLIWFSIVFIWLARHYVSKWVAYIILLITVVFNPTIFENFLIPWTSSLGAALFATIIWGLIQFKAYYAADDIKLSVLRARKVLIVSLATGLLIALRPADSIVGGVLYAGFLLMLLKSILVNKEFYTKQKVVKLFSLSFIAISLGPVLFFGYNYIVYDSLLGGYFAVATTNGFHLTDFFEKFISLWLDGYSLYLEPKSALIDHYPWLILSLLGIVYILLAGDWVLRCIVMAMFVQFCLYFPYTDLLPTGLWRYKNIHYFKWMFPYFGLFAWVFCLKFYYLFTLHKKIHIPYMIIFGLASLCILSYRPLISINLAHDIIEVKDRGEVIAFYANNAQIDFFDITGLTGSFTAIYFGSSRVVIDNKELEFIKDFRAVPAPFGIRVLLIRPIIADKIEFYPMPKLNFIADKVAVSLGKYKLLPGIPRPFWDEKSTIKNHEYLIGNTINFSQSGNAYLYKRRGWATELWGSQTVGKYSDISLKIANDSSVAEHVNLHMRASAFVNKLHKEQHLIMKLNHEVIWRYKFRYDAMEHEFNDFIIPLPDSLVRNGKNLTLGFILPDAISPSKLGIGVDKNELGLNLIELKIFPDN